MHLVTASRQKLAEMSLAPTAAVLSLHDPGVPAPTLRHAVAEHLVMAFHDIGEPIPGLVAPSMDHAQHIFAFVRRHIHNPQVVIQCEAGVGRSAAVCAAVLKAAGQSNAHILKMGTHNRLLYKMLLKASGAFPLPDSLVSLVVRVKYPSDRLYAFMLSVARQRWENWELVVVTDGPRPDIHPLLDHVDERRFRLIETPEARGRWGHPYRQLGIDAAQGDFIGLQNDDNYLTPGFMEQLVEAMRADGTDLAFCDQIHSYSGWGAVRTEAVQGSADLGCWLARASLLRKVPWQGEDFFADGRYVERLAKEAQGKVSFIPRPLFVKN